MMTALVPESEIHPEEIGICGNAGLLEILWSDGTTKVVAHQRLREACRCAHCLASSRRGQPVRAPDHIRIAAIEPYGNSTLRIEFDDGHQRGLYPYDYLRALMVSTATAR